MQKVRLLRSMMTTKSWSIDMPSPWIGFAVLAAMIVLFVLEIV